MRMSGTPYDYPRQVFLICHRCGHNHGSMPLNAPALVNPDGSMWQEPNKIWQCQKCGAEKIKWYFSDELAFRIRFNRVFNWTVLVLAIGIAIWWYFFKQ